MREMFNQRNFAPVNQKGDGKIEDNKSKPEDMAGTTLEQMGFKVIDISKDIPPEAFDHHSEQNLEIFHTFMNSITDRKFTNNQFAKHVIGAHQGTVGNNPEIVQGTIGGLNTYFNFNGSEWFDNNPKKPLLITSTDNEKFAKFVAASLFISKQESAMFSALDNSTFNPSIENLRKYLEIIFNESSDKDEVSRLYKSFPELMHLRDNVFNFTRRGDSEKSNFKNKQWKIAEENSYTEFSVPRSEAVAVALLLKKKLDDSQSPSYGYYLINPQETDALKKTYELEKVSFADISNIIVDLPNGKVYKRETLK